MSETRRVEAAGAVLEVGGRAAAPLVPPRIRGRSHLDGSDSPLAPESVPEPREGFPLLARPAPGSAACAPKDWAPVARRLLDERFEECGAVLLRGLPLETRMDFSEFYLALGYEPLVYHGIATREEVAPGVFTANLALPHRTIMMHNDLVHDPVVAQHVFLFCENPPPAGAGGETPVARNADWETELGEELIERFCRRGLLRRLHSPSAENAPGSPRTWQRRFQTEEPREVEAQCAELGESLQWLPDGGLTTERPVPVFREYNGKAQWFCSPHATFPASPVDFLYGDGEPLEPETVERLRVGQWNIAVAFAWEQRDVLCVDNIACQHGRLSFREDVDRRIFVSLATPRPGTESMNRASPRA